jgi:phosphonate transport system ATP-binding protein
MITINSLTKTYSQQVEALRGVDLEVDQGEFVVILGRSGAGKSTLIRCINRLVKPDCGEIVFNNSSMTKSGSKQLIQARKKIGMIFQQFNLVERLTVMENVLTGRLGHCSTLSSILGIYSDKDGQLAQKALERVGLTGYADHLARDLSGGQQQRVAIARALVQEPQVILGDEPVASLDPVAARSVLSLLKDINERDKITVILNMHAVELGLEYAKRVIGLKDGQVVCDGPASSIDTKVLEEIYGQEYGLRSI